MEASDGDGNSSCPERSCNVEGPGILVRLNAHQRNNPEIAATLKSGEQGWHVDAGICLVDRLDIDNNVRPKNPPLCGIGCNSV